MRLLGLVIAVLYIHTGKALAQNKPCFWLVKNQFTLSDSLSINPRSIIFSDKNKQVIEVKFEFNFAKNLIKIDSLALLKYDSIQVCYQTFAFVLHAKKFKRNPQLLDSLAQNQLFNVVIKPPLVEQREELVSVDGLNTTGNITRGVSFGNTQNVFVNSALNLQIDGKLSEDIGLKATITDQNVPFQPEGNTQTIQQFDRVFVQLSQKTNTLSAGDIIFRNKDFHFLKYYKNVQGASLEIQSKDKRGQPSITNIGVAVAKGKFASIQVQANEGVQGPYRLTGANGERFIVVIANSEKVFLDGKPLKRGFNLDYIIDYNNAEVTFTNQILITQFSRIRVDFEYAERNFNRTIWHFTQENTYQNWHFLGGVYQEGDNPNTPVNINLSAQDRLQLQEAGANIGLTFINGIDSTGFIQGQVMYQKSDTLVQGLLYKDILVASNNPNKAFFRVTFSEVGQNKGNYIRKGGTANGQVFQWIAPQNGIPQGNFEPIRLITPPNRKRLISLKTTYKAKKNEHLYAELAFSNQDLNLFSTLDNAQNRGNAFKVGYQNQAKKIGIKSKDYTLDFNIDYEITTTFFRPIDRFRYIEFDRDWSISTDSTQANDHIFTLQTGLKSTQNDFLNYKLVYRNRESQVNGMQHIANLEHKLGRNWGIKAQYFLLNNEQKITKSVWNRLNTELFYTLKQWQLGYQFNIDKNKVSQKNNDSIINTAMFFEENRFYIKRHDSTKNTFLMLDYTLRNDFLPQEGKIKPYIYSQNIGLQFQKKIHKNQDFNLIATYRTMQNTARMEIENPNFIPENLQGRLDYNAQFWDKQIRSDLSISTATGQELRREFQYIAVATGIGTHTWRDDNADGIQDLNEFYLAINPDERQFIKVFLPTNDYLRAFSYNFNYRLNIEMPRKWLASSQVWQKFWAKFALNTAYTLNRRSTKADVSSRFLPLGQDIFSKDVLATQANWRSILFFNRTNVRYGADVSYLQTQQKQLLNDGFELRLQQEIRLTYRQMIHKKWQIRWIVSNNLQTNRSDFLALRNFAILNQQISPELSFQPNNDLRVSILYALIDKKNRLPIENTNPTNTPETAQIQQINAEVRWNKVAKRSLLSNIRYWHIHYKGEPNTPVGYEMLEALRVGTNWTWNITLQQRLANGLQLNLTYEGRKVPNTPLINIGRVQVAALF